MAITMKKRIININEPNNNKKIKIFATGRDSFALTADELLALLGQIDEINHHYIELIQGPNGIPQLIVDQSVYEVVPC